jgi:hypothetical protein
VSLSEWRILFVVILSAIVVNGIIQIVIMFSFNMLNVVMLSVIICRGASPWTRLSIYPFNIPEREFYQMDAAKLLLNLGESREY